VTISVTWATACGTRTTVYPDDDSFRWPYAGTPVRYGGTDLYSTAAAISRNTFPADCDCTAYIAYAFNFPDALGAAAAAGTVKGPVLYVNTTGPINAATAAELTRLNPAQIVVVGSEVVISASVMTALKAYAEGNVVRYYGPTRFATAAAVSRNTFSPGVDVAYIAYASNFPDAAGGSAAAGTIKGPVLLVSTTGPIDSNTSAELIRLAPKKIIVLGSTTVISGQVMSALAPYAGTGGVVRYSGADRYATSATVSANTFPSGWGRTVYIGSGTDFNSILAGAAAAGWNQGPLLLVPTNGPIPASIAAELTRLQPTRIVVLGGTSVLSDSVYAALAAYVYV
jgi:putative cell wall-binding protein